MQIKNSLITAALMSFALAASAQVPSKNVPVPNKNLKTGETLRNVSAPIQEKIFLEDFTEWLCPKYLLRGDREFGGNGPKIKCEVSLRIGDNGGSLWADFYIWAQETVHDFSTTEGTWSRKIYDAPYGKRISRIVSDTRSRTQFVSPAAGFQFVVPGNDVKAGMEAFFNGTIIENVVLAAHGLPGAGTVSKGAIAKLIETYSQGNTVVRVPATEGRLVKFFHIVGDTGGDDISTDDNCNDDTRIVKIEFFPVTVEMMNK